MGSIVNSEQKLHQFFFSATTIFSSSSPGRGWLPHKYIPIRIWVEGWAFDLKSWCDAEVYLIRFSNPDRRIAIDSVFLSETCWHGPALHWLLINLGPASNVCYAEKVAKHSDNTLLRLVTFSAKQMLKSRTSTFFESLGICCWHYLVSLHWTGKESVWAEVGPKA